MTYHVAYSLAHTLKTPSMASQMRGVRSMSGRPLEVLRTWEGGERERERGERERGEREREREREREGERESVCV